MSAIPNFGYRSARAEARAMRALYAASLPRRVRRHIAPARSLPFEIYSYSGESALPEQVASIRSLLRHAGRPNKFNVVSDGTHSTRSLRLLRAIDPCVAVAHHEDWLPRNVPEEMRTYLAAHPTGKQLALIMRLPVDSPALYTDSDVLFFPGATALHSLDQERVRYLADCRLSADTRLFREEKERTDPVNTGVLFLPRKMDWSLGIARFLELEGAPDFFTNQTMTHLTLHANGGEAFDPRKFVLQLDDQFVHEDRYAARDIVLRHYVNPVRHKFWNAVMRGLSR
ncbi:MAG: hypothetical protein M3Z22_04065 [Verrucomicrobiota bacterium]|nr:hypothetical protein [Verrucomicrobiota bacterium]